MHSNRRLRILFTAVARGSLAALILAWHGTAVLADEADKSGQLQFEQHVQPILVEYCFGCHADGANEGSMSLDALLKMEDPETSKQIWYRVFKQLRAGLMPPVDEERPSEQQVATITNWIKYVAFGLSPDHPDPGSVTVRRLNQVEYRNTVRDLLGVDYDTAGNFPADDTGHGFDNIGDVLSVSPLLLEKYVNAAKEIVSIAVPTSSAVIREQVIPGEKFKLDPKPEREVKEEDQADQNQPPRRGFGFGPGRPRRGGSQTQGGPLELSYYEDATARGTVEIGDAGDYQLRLNLKAVESYVDNIFDLNKCEFTFAIDDDVLMQREFVRQGGKDFAFTFDRTLTEGPHEFVATVKPLSEEEQVRRLRLQIKSVDLLGPNDERYFVKPKDYDRFFPREVPDTASERREYARQLLGSFVARAFRRPVDDGTADRLVDLAETVYGEGLVPFESGIAKAMTAILASPRFLFREESTADSSSSKYPLLDEYSLASRLSYFLWSSMPDEELASLADDGKLRDNLDQQVARMLDDEKANAFVGNFVGQWLGARAIESVQISARSVLRRETPPDPEADERRRKFFELFRKGDDRTEEEEKEFQEARVAFRASFRRGPRVDLNGDVRRAMRRETEMLFEHIIKNDRSILEMVDSDYTFLNGTLARHYQIDGVEGVDMQRVELRTDSLRGGVLTQGTVLAVTSNPDRTSPVKRGLFILENLLGMPTPAPPPNIPALEDAAGDADKKLSLRETLAIHRENVLCSSCHDRMDPLGLALENFNALGRYRDQEFGQPIDAAGVLATGESFSSIKELKRILVTERKADVYRCLTEKMLTYALGRAVDYWDVETIDVIVGELEANKGRASSLISGIVHSPAFQRTRYSSKTSLAAN